jgi:hypothetical protein
MGLEGGVLAQARAPFSFCAEIRAAAFAALELQHGEANLNEKLTA